MEKGSSGNPVGRPKSRLLREALRKRLAEIKEDDPEKRTWAEVIASNLIEVAASKSPNAIAPQTRFLTEQKGDLRSIFKFPTSKRTCKAVPTRNLNFIWRTTVGPPTRRRRYSQHQSVLQPLDLSVARIRLKYHCATNNAKSQTLKQSSTVPLEYCSGLSPVASGLIAWKAAICTTSHCRVASSVYVQ